jgi:spermidine/putrescine transport system permease protein
MTFMLAAGSYAVPALLGGPGSRWFTEIVYNWFFEGSNWNQGAAYAFILLILCVAFVLAAMRAFRVGIGDVVK